MKFVLTLSFLLITWCVFSQSVSNEVSENFQKVEWLVGVWDRTNIKKPGRTAHEQWEKVSQNHLRGIGVTLQGADTLFVEKISIQVKDNTLYYIADVPENKEPVYFRLTAVTSTGFICENPQHDFPKKISYQLEGENLKAQISGDGKFIDYLFKRH